MQGRIPERKELFTTVCILDDNAAQNLSGRFEGTPRYFVGLRPDVKHYTSTNSDPTHSGTGTFIGSRVDVTAS